MFDYYKGLIALRKGHPIFRMKTREDVAANLKFFDQHLGMAVPPRCVAYRLTRGNSGDNWSQVVVLCNPNAEEVSFPLPEGKWTAVVDEDEAGDRPVQTGSKNFTKKARVPGRSALVLYLEEG